MMFPMALMLFVAGIGILVNRIQNRAKFEEVSKLAVFLHDRSMARELWFRETEDQGRMLELLKAMKVDKEETDAVNIAVVDYAKSENERIRANLQLIQKSDLNKDQDVLKLIKRLSSSGGRKQFVAEIDSSRTYWQSLETFAKIGFGAYSIFSLTIVLIGVALIKDPRPGINAASILMSFSAFGLFGLAVFFVVLGTPIVEFVFSPIVYVFYAAFIAVCGLLAVSGYSYRANREKIAYRRLGLRQQDPNTAVYDARTNKVMLCLNIAAAGIAMPIGLFVSIALFSTGFKAENSIVFWMGLAVVLILAFVLDGARRRINIIRLAKDREGWKIDVGLGKVYHLKQFPLVYSTSVLEACLMEVSLGMMGGRVIQKFDNPKYFIIVVGKKRLLFLPKDAAKFSELVVRQRNQ